MRMPLDANPVSTRRHRRRAARGWSSRRGEAAGAEGADGAEDVAEFLGRGQKRARSYRVQGSTGVAWRRRPRRRWGEVVRAEEPDGAGVAGDADAVDVADVVDPEGAETAGNGLQNRSTRLIHPSYQWIQYYRRWICG